jgi:hypothetical protein
VGNKAAENASNDHKPIKLKGGIHMITKLIILACALIMPLAFAVTSALAQRPPFVFPSDCCFYNDTMVRTVVPPAAFPRAGTDNFYGFPNGAAEGQKGVVAVVPGAPDYNGGAWRFFAVTWNVTPYLLTSETAVLDAETAGDVTITRDPTMDFRCPIQP